MPNKDVGSGAGCHLRPDDLGLHFNAVLLLYEEVDATAQSNCIDDSGVINLHFSLNKYTYNKHITNRRHVQSHTRTRKSQFEKTNIEIIGEHILKMLISTLVATGL